MWFDVDKGGLAKLLERKGKAFALMELIQNSLDTNAGSIIVTLEPVPNSPRVQLTVVDDDPDGFKDLSHAFTLFADSLKKGDPEKRGRFNLGEKLVLAMCDNARIQSTTGAVLFDEQGRHKLRTCTERGSVFSGRLRMTREEMNEAIFACRRLIVPAGVKLLVNGFWVSPRTPVAVFETSLPTEIADEEGVLRKTTRKTEVRVYETLPDEPPSLYEMGIPVVETGDRYHIDVMQKVPLNMDRDNVPPSYLKQLRAMVLNATFSTLGKDDVTQPWVRDGLAHPLVVPEAVTSVLNQRFTDKAVRFDPSDPEANKLAAEAGYVVVHGGSLSHDEWTNVNRTDRLRPAGQVTPSQPLSTEPPNYVLPTDWTCGVRNVAELAIALAQETMGIKLFVRVINNPNVSAAATYGNRTLTFNVGRLTRSWFFRHNLVEINALLIHEFAHEYAGDHKSDKYYEACCMLGSKFTELAYTRPEFFNDKKW